MTNQREMDKFLKDLANLYIQNPTIPITSDNIYYNLSMYGLTDEERKNKEVINENNQLQQIFANARNLKVYYSEYQPGFLQFSNYNKMNSKCVKLYLSVSKENFVSANKKIFSFIEANNMPTCSKTALKLRSDSIVIRLNSYEDAKKVLDFINSDSELVSQAKPTNPFSFKEGIVGVGYDDLLSYNSTTADIISYYLDELRSKNNLQNAGLEGFIEFVEQYYRNNFINCNALGDLIKSKSFNEMSRRIESKGQQVNNLEQIVNLLLNTLKGTMNFDIYKSFYQSCLNDDKNNQMISYYDCKINNIINPPIRKGNTAKLNSPVFSIKQLLDDYINYAAEKYGKEEVYNYLSIYLKGEPRAITRDKGFRDNFIKYLPPQMLMDMYKDNLKDYIASVIDSKVSEKDKYLLFMDSCLATFKKYNKNQLLLAINNGINNNFQFFTNGDKGYRNQMIQKINSEEILAYCKLYLESYNYKVTQGLDVVSTFCNLLESEYVNEPITQTY